MAYKRTLNLNHSELSEWQFEESGILDLLEIIPKDIDFLEGFYKDKEEVWKRIRNIRALLGNEDIDKDVRKKLQRELKDLESAISSEDKFIILIDQLSYLLKFHEIRIAVFDDGACRIYSKVNKYWKKVNEGIVTKFMIEAAIKVGIGKVESQRKTLVEKMKFHFNEKFRIERPERDVNCIRIPLQNCVVEIKKGQIVTREHNYSDYLTYILPFDYEASASPKQFLEFLDVSLPEKEAQALLAEVIGLIFAPHINLELLPILQGPGRTGKSTLMKILSAMLGEENIASFTLSELAGKASSCAYHRAELPNYLLNWSSEMGGRDCDPEMVKKIISREPVEGRSPYGKPFTVRNYCPSFFNVNELPAVENTTATWRRLCIIPFHNVVPGDKVDVGLADRIINTELPGVLNWVLSGLTRLMKNNQKLTKSKLCEDVKAILKMENNPVEAFIQFNNYVKTTSGKEYMMAKTLYTQFVEFASENGFKASNMSSTTFYRRLENLGFVVDRNAANHQYRVYCKHKELDIFDI